MSKIKIILILLTALIVASYLMYFSGGARENSIRNEIVKANYCDTSSQCKLAAMSSCPFGCHIYVNENEVNRIEGILTDYQNNAQNRGKICMYSCVAIQGVECVNNSCQVIQ